MFPLLAALQKNVRRLEKKSIPGVDWSYRNVNVFCRSLAFQDFNLRAFVRTITFIDIFPYLKLETWRHKKKKNQTALMMEVGAVH